MEKIRVVEAFSGIGSQKKGLRDLGIEHEVVATMEIDKYATISYAAIHHNLEKHLNYKNQNKKEEREYLLNLGIEKVPKNKKQLHQCYIANKLSKNLGDISNVDEKEVPNHDLFTYSFPCQDISTAGKQKGLDEESETKSSLLWECRRIIKHKKPKYLFLENVKNLVSKTHKENFLKWLNELEEMGYVNHWAILDAKDYNIPQHRERVFAISVLKEEYNDFIFPKKEKLEILLKDILEKEVDSKYILTESKKEHYSRDFGSKGKMHTLDTPYTQTLTAAMGCGGGNKPVLEYINKQGETEYREFTPKECWRLMGFEDEDIDKAMKFCSNTQLYKQAGNSIVVNVVKKLFVQLLPHNQIGIQEEVN